MEKEVVNKYIILTFVSARKDDLEPNPPLSMLKIPFARHAIKKLFKNCVLGLDLPHIAANLLEC
jgi:hypothetical protein